MKTAEKNIKLTEKKTKREGLGEVVTFVHKKKERSGLFMDREKGQGWGTAKGGGGGEKRGNFAKKNEGGLIPKLPGKN